MTSAAETAAELIEIEAGLTASFFDGSTFLAPRMAEWLRGRYPAAIGGRRLYSFRDGAYALGEEFLRGEIIKLLGSQWNRRRADEVIAYLLQSSEPLWDAPPGDRIAVANGILSLADRKLAEATERFRSPFRIAAAYDPGAACPAVERFLEALEALYRQGGAPGDDEPVFASVERKPAARGRRPSTPGSVLSPRMVTKAFRRYADRAELPNVTLRDLRHTTITRLIQQGAPIDVIAAIAGHSKTSTTTDVYGHRMRGHLQDAATRFNPAAFPTGFPTREAATTSNNDASPLDERGDLPVTRSNLPRSST